MKAAFFAGVLWGVILTITILTLAVSYAPSLKTKRTCDVTVSTDPVEVVYVGRPCEART